MPVTWNYIFAGLPAIYTSAEVEQQIKDESSIWKNQESAAAYMTRGTGKTNKTDSPTPGQPFCMNCKKNSHLIKDCWSSGGGKEGQGLRQKKRKDDDKKGKKKGRKRANLGMKNSDDEQEDDSRSV